MRIAELTAQLEQLAPLRLQEAYDNAGLICGDPNATVERALLCLDSIESVVDEAIEKNCQLIIAHHPIIFRGLKRLTGANYVEKTVIKAIKNDIAIYAIHTNLDNVQQGVNLKICKKIGLHQLEILSPKPGIESNGVVGSGMKGLLLEPKKEIDFLLDLKAKFNCRIVRHTDLLNKEIHKVAVCGGSGSSFLPDAIEQGCDIFVTADFTYHQFFDAENRIVIADIGHYESEQFTSDLLCDYLRDKFPTFAVLLSEVNTNPINYT